MNENRKAVFLSYASQDAAAASRIAEALRAVGVEVWFDKSELRGGDAWDTKIRRQIKECALFVPIISASTQARPEGYFRLEWKLAVDRSHLMADDQPFLLPVIIDDVPDATARVPDRFREVQWTRLRQGYGGQAPVDATSAEFGERVRRLLQGDAARTEEPTRQERGQQRRRREGTTLETILRYWWLPLPFLGLAFAFRGMGGGETDPKPAPAASAATAANAEGAALVQRAHAIFDRGDLTRENLRAAEELCDRAIALDAMSAEAWAARAQVHAWFSFYNYDRTESRRAKAKADAARAMNLAPQSYEVRLAHAAVLSKTILLPAARKEAEEVLLALAKERADDFRVFDHLGLVLRAQGRMDEAAGYFLKANNPGGAAWTYTAAGDYPRAMEAVEEALKRDSAVSSITLKAILEYRWREDLDAAQETIRRLPGSTLLDESFAMNAVFIALYRRESEEVLRLVQSLPGDYLSALGFTGPKAALLAFAHEIAGRTEAAKAEWRAALAVMEQKLKEFPNDPSMLWWKASALVGLGEADAAAAQLKLALELAGAPADYVGEGMGGDSVAGLLVRLGQGDRVMDWLERRFAEKKPGWERFHSAARFHRDYDPLRGNARFERLLRENLPAGAKPM